jgi:hypothetical protein
LSGVLFAFIIMAVNEFGFADAKLPETFVEHDVEAPKPIQYIRLNKCHDFKETQLLWKNAADRTAKIGAVLVVCYLFLGYFLLAYLDGMRGIDCWYFLATTLTTVMPKTQHTVQNTTYCVCSFICLISVVSICRA